jgi:hypothetical protein
MSKNIFSLLIDSDNEDSEFVEVKPKKQSKIVKDLLNDNSDVVNVPENNNSKESSNEEGENNECYVLNKGDLEKLGYFKKFNSEWNLWYHHELNNWRIDGYRKIFHLKNIKDFWDLHNNIDCLGGVTNQHFFLMRDNILPIWEDTANRNGGSWSIKLNDISNVFNIWLKLATMMMGETIVKDEKHRLSKLVVGLSINLRNQNTCIIKIWNRDASLQSIKLLNDEINKEFGYNIIYKKNIVEY